MSFQVAASGIGTLREKHLHASLKRWYARPGDRAEIAVDGYVIDLVRDDLLIEIQTRGFAELRPKATALLSAGHRLRIVHPIAVDRWIVRVDADGTFLGRRRSPSHGDPADLAPALVSIPDLLAHPGFEIEVLLIAEEEYRRHEAGRCWRRRGWTVVERRLVDVVDRVLLAHPADLLRLLPDDLPERFTTTDIALALGRSSRIAQQLAYCLRRLELIEVVGKRGRAVEYQLVARR